MMNKTSGNTAAADLRRRILDASHCCFHYAHFQVFQVPPYHQFYVILLLSDTYVLCCNQAMVVIHFSLRST
jgi:hypothetical protein